MTRELAPRLTIEEMRQIVNCSDSLDHYGKRLADLKKQINGTEVDWPAFLTFLSRMDEAFAALFNPPAPADKTSASSNEATASKDAAPGGAKSEVRKPANTYTHEGFSGTLPEICERFDQPYQTIYGRLRQGMSISEALTTSPRHPSASGGNGLPLGSGRTQEG